MGLICVKCERAAEAQFLDMCGYARKNVLLMHNFAIRVVMREKTDAWRWKTIISARTKKRESSINMITNYVFFNVKNENVRELADVQACFKYRFAQ